MRKLGNNGALADIDDFPSGPDPWLQLETEQQREGALRTIHWLVPKHWKSDAGENRGPSICLSHRGATNGDRGVETRRQPQRNLEGMHAVGRFARRGIASAQNPATKLPARGPKGLGKAKEENHEQRKVLFEVSPFSFRGFSLSKQRDSWLRVCATYQQAISLNRQNMMETDIKEIIDRARRHGASPEYLLSLAKVLGVAIPDETETDDQ